MSPVRIVLIAAAFCLALVAVVPSANLDASDDCCSVYHNGAFTPFDSLKDALDSAVSGDTIVVYDGCSLDADATVKEGVTLLVPYRYSDDPSDDWNGQGGDPTKTDISRKPGIDTAYPPSPLGNHAH